MKSKPPAGTVVRFTGTFLRNTGQITATPGARVRWAVIACDCGLCVRGRFVAVDEPSIDAGGPRHMAIGNLERVK
jgi:hypothetical protein